MNAQKIICCAAISFAALSSNGARAADDTAQAMPQPLASQAPQSSQALEPLPVPAAAVAPPVVSEITSARAIAVKFSRTGLSGARMKDEMDGLRVVRQADTGNAIGTQVALNVGLALLTGGRGFTAQGFSKDDLVGIEPEGATNLRRLINPGLYALPDEMERAITRWKAGNPKTQAVDFHKPLVVNSASWTLVYNSLDMADATYVLKLNAEIFKEREKYRWPMPSRRPGTPCTYSSEPRSLEAWKANDYQAVVDLAPAAVSYCVNYFLAQMPELLELE